MRLILDIPSVRLTGSVSKRRAYFRILVYRLPLSYVFRTALFIILYFLSTRFGNLHHPHNVCMLGSFRFI